MSLTVCSRNLYFEQVLLHRTLGMGGSKLERRLFPVAFRRLPLLNSLNLLGRAQGKKRVCRTRDVADITPFTRGDAVYGSDEVDIEEQVCGVSPSSAKLGKPFAHRRHDT